MARFSPRRQPKSKYSPEDFKRAVAEFEKTREEQEARKAKRKPSKKKKEFKYDPKLEETLKNYYRGGKKEFFQDGNEPHWAQQLEHLLTWKDVDCGVFFDLPGRVRRQYLASFMTAVLAEIKERGLSTDYLQIIRCLYWTFRDWHETVSRMYRLQQGTKRPMRLEPLFFSRFEQEPYLIGLMIDAALEIAEKAHLEGVLIEDEFWVEFPTESEE